MANSTYKLGNAVSNAKLMNDIAAVVQSDKGGLSLEPALTIANDVMTELISEHFNWKWNRFALPLFYTNSLQQDYALNVVNLGWLDYAVLVDINNTQTPKPIWSMEVVRELPQTSNMFGMPGQACWLPNYLLTYGVWPGANVTYTQPLNPPAAIAATPPLTQIQDPNGNYWVVTGYGTTGSVQPTWPTSGIVFPTPQSPTQAPTTVTDGSVTWSALNPVASGIRVNPLPGPNNVIYQFRMFGQYRPLSFQDGGFTSFSQTIEPIPDDFAAHFRAGFRALAYQYSPDPRIRAKAADIRMAWLTAMETIKMQANRERENFGFYPATSLMENPGMIYPGPAYPFPIPF